METGIVENAESLQWWKEEQIRYWQETTDHYLKFGTTIQAGIFLDDASAGESYDDNNQTILTRSGLRSGQVVLDAGCGVGGPGLYAALHTPGLEVHGITLSPYQAELAQRLIADSPPPPPWPGSCSGRGLPQVAVSRPHIRLCAFSGIRRIFLSA